MPRVKQPVSIDDLRSGKVWRIDTRQLSRLDGSSPTTHERKRWKGTSPLPFQRDENGYVYYLTKDVLAYLDKLGQRIHRSTSEYDTSTQVARLAKAREVLQQKEWLNRLLG